MFFAYYESPIGWIEIGGTAAAATSVRFVEERPPSHESHATVVEAARQLAEYFAGHRRQFQVPISLQGTDFQRRVWEQVLAVPYGTLASYQDIADALGNPNATRAVGAANGQNPIAILVPCHRIVGSDGGLTGYGGGLWRKEYLLRHEGSLLL